MAIPIIKVLLVEDNPGDARLVRELLAEVRGRSFEIFWANRLAKGLEHAAGEDIDIILLDLELPDTIGKDALEITMQAAADTPIIVLTSRDDEELAARAVRNGAQDYLIKGSIDPHLLNRAIFYAIERKRAEEALARSRRALQADRDRLEIIMENSPQANLVLLDPDFKFIRVNSTYAEGWHQPREFFPGKNIFDLYPNEANVAIFRQVRDSGEAVGFKEMPFEFRGMPARDITYWDWTLTPVKDAAGEVETLVFSLVDVTEKVQARKFSETLNEINNIISSSLQFEQIMHRAMAAATEALYADSSLLALGSDGAYEYRFTFGLESQPEGTLLNPDEVPVAALALSNRRTIAVSEAETDPRLSESAIRTGLVSGIAAPMITKGNVIGVISFRNRKHSIEYSKAHIDFVEKLAAAFSLAIETSELYRQEYDLRSRVQAYATQLSLLHDIGLSLNRETNTQRLLKKVLESAAEITAAGIGAMILIEDDKTQLVSMYYAPWIGERCTIEADPSYLHRRIEILAATSERDTIRINDFSELEHPLIFPNGHVGIQGLLIGSLRDTLDRKKGYFMLSAKAEGSNFTSDDEEIIALLAAQASVAMISAQNFEHEHQVAETLQTALLPVTPRREDIEIGLVYHSSTSFSRLGGDFYDFIELDGGRLAVALGDVSGKGLEAATATAMVKYSLRTVLDADSQPASCLARVNRVIGRQLAMEKFVTLGLLEVDPQDHSFTYANAGHPQPVFVGEDKTQLVEVSHSLPLGVLPDYDYTATKIAAPAGSTIIIYSDGLTEARTEGGEPFGEQRVLDRVQELKDLPAQEVATRLMDSAVDYSAGQLRDDIAIVVIRMV